MKDPHNDNNHPHAEMTPNLHHSQTHHQKLLRQHEIGLASLNRGNWLFPAVFLGIGTLLWSIILIIIFLNLQIYQHLQNLPSATCTINRKELKTATDTSTDDQGNTSTSDLYQAYFYITVHAPNNHTYPAEGYDGSYEYTGDRNQQQASLNQFSLNHTYPCKYDPQHPTTALLVIHPPTSPWLLYVILGFLGLIFNFLGAAFFISMRSSNLHSTS